MSHLLTTFRFLSPCPFSIFTLITTLHLSQVEAPLWDKDNMGTSDEASMPGCGILGAILLEKNLKDPERAHLLLLE